MKSLVFGLVLALCCLAIVLYGPKPGQTSPEPRVPVPGTDESPSGADSFTAHAGARIELAPPPLPDSSEHQDRTEAPSDPKPAWNADGTGRRILDVAEAREYVRSALDEDDFVAALLEIGATAETPGEMPLYAHSIRDLYDASTESLARLYSHGHQHATETIAEYERQGNATSSASAAHHKAMHDILFSALPNLPQMIRDKTIDVRVRMYPGRGGTSFIYGTEKDHFSCSIGRQHRSLRLTFHQEHTSAELWMAYERAYARARSAK